jgi:hypothetical protein
VLAEAIQKWGRLIKFAGIKRKTIILRDYIKATVGFEKLGEATNNAAEEPHLACLARVAIRRPGTCSA